MKRNTPLKILPGSQIEVAPLFTDWQKNSADFQRSKKSSIEKLDARRNIERLTPLFFYENKLYTSAIISAVKNISSSQYIAARSETLASPAAFL